MRSTFEIRPFHVKREAMHALFPRTRFENIFGCISAHLWEEIWSERGSDLRRCENRYCESSRYTV